MFSSMQPMQFLMGLHESFDKEKSQLLMMDPLPDLEKAFSMIFVVEQQRNVQTQIAKVSLRDNKKEGNYRQTQRRRTSIDKRSMLCTHFHKSGHLKETCFKLHGTPECENRFENRSADLLAELLKLVRNKETPSDPISNFAKYVHTEEQFVGNSFDSSVLNVGDWIIDTGATNHVCGHLSCFDTYSAPSHKHFIHFLDGTKKQVAYIGIVRISDKQTLNSVVYVPDFSVNLLSDQATIAIVAQGMLKKNLYIVHCAVFKPLVTSIVAVPNSCTVVVDCNDSLWHRRLGMPL
ncbi:UNVERIFIED_CONTAM: hypothetical protein Sindi_2036400 [Sesamum indicum]